MLIQEHTEYFKRVSEKIMQTKSLFIYVDSFYQTADVGDYKDHFILQMVFAKTNPSLYVVKSATSMHTILTSTQ